MKQGYEAIRLTDKELTKHVSRALYDMERPPVMHNTLLYNMSYCKEIACILYKL